MDDTDSDIVHNQLTTVLFDLLRDHVPVGTLEKLIIDMEKHPPPYIYAGETSARLSELALGMAQRILTPTPNHAQFHEKKDGATK